MGVACVLAFIGAFGMYSYSMAKLKNGLTYFHSQIVRQDGDVEALEIQYEDIDWQFPFGLLTEKLQLDITTSGTDQHVQMLAKTVGSQLKGVTSGVLKISAHNLLVHSAQTEKPLLSNQYKIRKVEIRFVEYESYVSIFNPDKSMRRVYGDLAQLLERGDTNGRLNMQGVIYFEFGKGRAAEQRFHTQTVGNLTRIVLDRNDLNTVAPQFASRLSDGDLDLVANHPLKAPRLLEIRKETEEKAKELRWALQSFPEDVYRHVLWSYLLTKEYGAEFAHLVTNAHEYGSFNTEDEIAKDRQNNRIGITYAQNNVPEKKLLEKIRSDPRIHF